MYLRLFPTGEEGSRCGHIARIPTTLAAVPCPYYFIIVCAACLESNLPNPIITYFASSVSSIARERRCQPGKNHSKRREPFSFQFRPLLRYRKQFAFHRHRGQHAWCNKELSHDLELRTAHLILEEAAACNLTNSKNSVWEFLPTL